jgi:hypothetical protein
MGKVKQNKVKKIIFDERTDSTINGFAVVLAFVGVGIILQLDNNFFGLATNFIKIVFIVVGILGFITEVNRLNFKNDIKGLYNLLLGVFLLIILIAMKTYIHADSWFFIIKYFYQVLLFLFILFSIYGFARGLIEMIYSIMINYKKDNGKLKKESVFKNIVFVLSQLFGLLLIIAQIYAIFK